MKFSLKTFVALVIFLGVVAGLISRRIRVSRPLSVSMNYDVINAKDRISGNYPAPEEMIMWRDPSLYRRLRKQAAAELPLSDEALLQGFFADPSKYVWYDEKHKQIVRENRDVVLSRTERWLKLSSPNLLNVALMRAIHDDREGFDLLKKKMIGDLKSGPTFLFGTFPEEWWHDDQELRDAMHQMLTIDEIGKEPIVGALRSMGEILPWISHHLAAAKAEESYRRLSAIRSLTEEELSERTFDLLQSELIDKSADHRQDELAELLARFFQADNPQLREKAFALCKQLSMREIKTANPRGQRNEFYAQLCLHGGEKHIGYFVRGVKERRIDCAMEALVRLWPKQKAADFAKEHKYYAVVAELLGREALPYLRERIREEPGLYLARLAIAAAEGQPDPVTADLFESLLPEIEDWAYDPPYIEGRELLKLMQRLGRENTDALQSQLPDLDPEFVATNMNSHWIFHDIDQQMLVDFLNTEKVGQTIRLEDVYKQIAKNGRPRDDFEHNDLFDEHGYDVRNFAFHALEASGIAHECLQSDSDPWYQGKLLALINKHSVGANSLSPKSAKDHRIWMAPKYTPPKMHVTFECRTFELNVFEDQTHPVLIAEALNNMLEKYTEYDHRFFAYICYPDGWDEHYVAYLKPEVAKQLEKDFGLIPFPPY